MDIYKKIQKIQIKLAFLYLIVFPFGQLLRIESVFGYDIPIYLTDLIIGISFVLSFRSGSRPLPKSFSAIFNFWVIAAFSLTLSLAFFEPVAILTGVLYLVRFAAYSFYFVNIWRLVRKDRKLKKLIINSLIAIGVFVAIFGWAQYVLYPDTRALIEYGWDDHLYRLISTFLDPAFTGIILVFAIILIFLKLEHDNKFTKANIAIITFLLVSLAFTYSRASFLSLGVAGVAAYLLGRGRKILLPALLVFFLGLTLLPRGESEGVKLERPHSIVSKAINYRETVEIIGKSPLFGVGFNNLCIARTKLFTYQDPRSHSCDGADNSFLFVMATTGIVGFIVFIYMIKELISNTKKGIYGEMFYVSGAALIAHSFFTNTLFYAWVLGWMAHLLAVSRDK